MIKLRPGDPPASLTPERVRTLTDKFKQDGKPVWKQRWLRDALLALSNGKCCYSECRLDESGAFLEVEHFWPKSLYPEAVLRWSNLLPCSKTCNGRKGDWDTKARPIIHPCYDDPRDHLELRAFRFYAKTEKGANTLEATDINDHTYFATPRARLAFEILDDLEALAKFCQHLTPTQATQQARPLQKQLVSRLRWGRPEEPYAAIISTSILTSPALPTIRTAFEQWGLWNMEHEELIYAMRQISYE